jgi:soluble lytic murein transglycosylase-like protein
VSIDAAVARVSELSALLRPVAVAAAVAAPAATSTAPTQQAFSAQLAGAMSTSAATPSATGGNPFAAEISAAAARNGVDPKLLTGLIRAESNFNPKATSPAGAQGLTQLMPATAAGLGVTNPLDPAQAIEGGARYLRQQLDRFGGDASKALAAYNAGPGAVERFGGVPPYAETQDYVRKVQSYAAELRTAAPIASLVAAPVSSSPSVNGIL